MSAKDWTNSCSASLEPGERERDLFSAEYVHLEKASILDINLRVFLETLMCRFVIFLLVVLNDSASWEDVNIAIMSEVSETLPPCYRRTYIALGSSKEIKHGLLKLLVWVYCMRLKLLWKNLERAGDGLRAFCLISHDLLKCFLIRVELADGCLLLNVHLTPCHLQNATFL